MISRFGNFFVPLLILLQLLIEVMSQNATSADPVVQAEKKTAIVYKYWIFSEQCYNTLVINRNFAEFECIKFVKIVFTLDCLKDTQLWYCDWSIDCQSTPNSENHHKQKHIRSIF